MATEGQQKNELPILIVDNDPSSLPIVTASLARAGWTHEVAATGGQALILLHRTRYRVVLLELALPDLNGIEILRQILLLSDPPPVILISGSGTIGSAVEVIKLGAQDLLEKPLHIADLLNVIATSRREPFALSAKADGDVFAEVARLILVIQGNDHDVKTIGEWARLVFLTPQTLSSRCARVGTTAKHALDFGRLLRVITRRSTKGTSASVTDHLNSFDARTPLALVRRAGIQLEDLATCSPSEFVRRQALVVNPLLIDGLDKTLRNADCVSKPQALDSRRS